MFNVLAHAEIIHQGGVLTYKQLVPPVGLMHWRSPALPEQHGFPDSSSVKHRQTALNTTLKISLSLWSVSRLDPPSKVNGFLIIRT